MIYDKDDALYDSLEAVIDCPSAIWLHLAIYLFFPPGLNFERESNQSGCYSLSLCILGQGGSHDELLIDKSLQSTCHWQDQIGFA